MKTTLAKVPWLWPTIMSYPSPSLPPSPTRPLTMQNLRLSKLRNIDDRWIMAAFQICINILWPQPMSTFIKGRWCGDGFMIIVFGVAVGRRERDRRMHRRMFASDDHDSRDSTGAMPATLPGPTARRSWRRNAPSAPTMPDSILSIPSFSEEIYLGK